MGPLLGLGPSQPFWKLTKLRSEPIPWHTCMALLGHSPIGDIQHGPIGDIQHGFHDLSLNQGPSQCLGFSSDMARAKHLAPPSRSDRVLCGPSLAKIHLLTQLGSSDQTHLLGRMPPTPIGYNVASNHSSVFLLLRCSTLGTNISGPRSLDVGEMLLGSTCIRSAISRYAWTSHFSNTLSTF